MATTPRRRSWLLVAIGIVAGIAGGYASVALGATGVVLAVVIVVLAAAGMSRDRLVLPLTLIGIGLGGLLTLAPTLLTARLCTATAGSASSSTPSTSDCYLPLTLVAAVVFTALGLMGVLGTYLGARR
jgi:hypothetical protein